MNNGNYIEEMDQAFDYEERMDEILDKAYKLVKEYFIKDFDMPPIEAELDGEHNGTLEFDFFDGVENLMHLFVTTGTKGLEAWYINKETGWKDTWLGPGEFQVEDIEDSFEAFDDGTEVYEIALSLAAEVVAEVEEYLSKAITYME